MTRIMWSVALALVACQVQVEDESEEPSLGAVRAAMSEANEVVLDTELPPRAAGIERGLRQVTAEGEVSLVTVESVPAPELVPLGASCGTELADGTVTECAPGLVCLAAAERTEPVCVPAPRAVRFDG
jgi:predicted secreted protein